MRQGKIMLLTLVLLGLPMAASASNFTFFDTGTFNTGVVTNVNASQGFNAGVLMALNLVGSTERFMLAGLTLSTGCATAAAGTCTFPSGTLTVFTGSTLALTASLINGMIDKDATANGQGTGVLTAELIPTSMLPFCKQCFLTIDLTWQGSTLVAGSGTVAGEFVPEPSTLWLMGSGLISLAGLARRKLKLPI